MDQNIQELLLEVCRFRDARDWAKFHTFKNLAVSLSIEAAELLELTQWSSDAELKEKLGNQEFVAKVSDEVADVLIYLLLICEKVGVDPLQAARMKVQQNNQRYPVEKSRGNARKHTDLD